MQNIGQNGIKNLQISLPELTQQRQIVRDLSETLVPLNLAITRYEREITLLREYRTRLTADVVTGKLDVRAAAAKLPEETLEEVVAEADLSDEEPELEEVE